MKKDLRNAVNCNVWMDSRFNSIKPALKLVSGTIRKIWILDDMKRILNIFKVRNGILMMMSPALLVTHTEVKSGFMLQNTVTVGVKSVCMVDV